MDIGVESRPGALIVRAGRGKIVASNSGELLDRIRENLHEDTKVIVIDISMVEFIDSKGLGVFISLCRGKGQPEVRIVGASDMISKLFHLTRLDRVLKLCDNDTEALAGL